MKASIQIEKAHAEIRGSYDIFDGIEFMAHALAREHIPIMVKTQLK